MLEPHRAALNATGSGRGIRGEDEMQSCRLLEKKSGHATEVDFATALEAARGGNGYVYIHLSEPTQEELESIARELDLHELTIEDLQNDRVRSKVEEFENHLFVVLKAPNFAGDRDSLEVVNLNLLLFRNTLICVHRKPVAAIQEFEEELSRRPAIMQRGPSFIMYRILDRLVDGYFPVLDDIDETTDDIQTRLFERFDPSVSSLIFAVKTRIMHLHRRIGPQREILMNLANRPEALIPPKIQIYYRDVYDHIIRIHDALESYRDVLQSAMDSYMTLVSYRMNQVMKVLSVVATIMLPLSLLAGVFGTNFEFLPGSHYRYGFWVFVGVLAAIGTASAIYFKKRHWF